MRQFILVILVHVALPGAGWSAEVKCGRMKIADKAGFVNVREKPDGISKILGKIDTDTDVYACPSFLFRNWMRVIQPDLSLLGFVHATHLKQQGKMEGWLAQQVQRLERVAGEVQQKEHLVGFVFDADDAGEYAPVEATARLIAASQQDQLGEKYFRHMAAKVGSANEGMSFGAARIFLAFGGKVRTWIIAASSTIQTRQELEGQLAWGLVNILECKEAMKSWKNQSEALGAQQNLVSEKGEVGEWARFLAKAVWDECSES